MKYYVPGHESMRRVELLIKLTRIDSEDIKSGVRHHLTDGWSIGVAAFKVGVDESNLNRALTSINDKLIIHEDLKELDWPDYNAYKRSVKSLREGK